MVPSFPNTTGYWLFLNGTQGACTTGNGCVGSATGSPYTFMGSDCGVTNTLGLEAHDGSGNHGPLWTTPYTSPACASNSLPTGVTLAAVDGDTLNGSNTNPNTTQNGFYCTQLVGMTNGTSNACLDGWDNASFFPIEDIDIYPDATTSEMKTLGINTSITVNGGTDLTPLRTAGLYNNENGSAALNYGAETIGAETDEPGDYPTFLSNLSSQQSEYGVTNKWIQVNLTWNALANETWTGSSACGGTGSVAISTLLKCNISIGGQTARRIQVMSTDAYWFAGRNNATYQAQCPAVYNFGGSCTIDQMARASNYGDFIDEMRTWFTSAGVPGIESQYIENQCGLITGNCTVMTPAEMNWTEWDMVIHGARAIQYFIGGNNQGGSSFASTGGFNNTTTVGGTTMAAQVGATNGAIANVAPIINAPFALGFETCPACVYTWPTWHDTLDNGIDASAHWYNGGSFTNSLGTFGNGFYIVATVRGSESQSNVSATFTLPSTDAASGSIPYVCACSPTQSTGTVTVTNHQFTTTFAHATDVHIIGPLP